MKTADFDFTLPEHLIASQPAEPRGSARMLVVDAGLRDEKVADILQHLRAGDVMVFNDTKVIPARLMGKRGEAKLEVLLHKKLDSGFQQGLLWQCFAKPAKKLRAGDVVEFAVDFSAEVLEKREDGQVILRFDASYFQEKLARYGAMPLPPYIEKQRASVIASVVKQSSASGSPRRDTPRDDKICYQTVYAQHEGSVAAPTAGLHFTPELLAAIDALGVARVHVTLHVGGGTFLPVKVEDTTQHVMHSEYAEISQEAAARINAAKAAGGRVICVGTTSLRTLESAAREDGNIEPFARETNIFITPGYHFKAVDMLLTNFHLPKSTLFMLVSAFAGLAQMQAAYRHAIAEKYRFYSYGDACLLYKKHCHSECSEESPSLLGDPSPAVQDDWRDL